MSSHSGVSQNFSDKEQHQIDSLNALIANSNSHDTSLAGAYVALSEILHISNIDTLKYLCEKAKGICENALADEPKPSVKKSLLITLSNALNNIGYVAKVKGDIPLALKLYHESLRIKEEVKDKMGMALSYNNMGVIYKQQGDIPRALEFYHKSLKICEEVKDKKGIGLAFNNIGVIHKTQGDISLALKFYHKSLEIYEELNNKRWMSLCYNNIGLIHSQQGNIPLAVEFYTKSINIRESINDLKGLSQTYNNIGIIHRNQGNIPLALAYYKKSLKICEKLNDKNGIALYYHNTGVIYKAQGNLIAAEENGLQSLSYAQEVGSPRFIKDASLLLSSVYEKQGKGLLALEMYKLYITMRDSLNNEVTQKANIQQQAKYEYEKQKAIDDAEHDKLLAIEQEEKEKQQILTVTTAGGLGLVVVFLIFVFNRLHVTKKQKLVIQEQKAEVEQQKEVVLAAHAQLEEKNTEIMDSIAYAKRIQSAILPPDKLVKKYLKQSFILYKPKDVVAGDFYWLESVPSSRHSALDAESPYKDEIAGQASNNEIVLFAAADCTGHGVPGAMVSVICNNGLNRAVREYGLTDPGKILDKTREIVIQEFEKSEEEVKDGMDIAICSIDGDKLQYAGAHNPLWIIRNGEILEIKANSSRQTITNYDGYSLLEVKADKQPIGQFDTPSPYTTHDFQLETGDAIYLFSDGYVDQFGGEKGKKFKSKAFKTLLLSIQDKSMEEQKTIIEETFETWKGTLEQIDDVCIIGVRI